MKISYNWLKQFLQTDWEVNKTSELLTDLGLEVEGVEYPLVKLEISRTSHPFYTGKSKLIDAAGRIDKFKSKYAKHKK